MLPSLAKNNAAYAGLVNAELYGKSFLSAAVRVQASNLPDFIRANLGAAIARSAHVKQPVSPCVQDVIEVRYVLQIFDVVIQLVAVFVVNAVLAAFTPKWARRLWQKSCGNKRMNVGPGRVSRIAERNAWVSAAIWLSAQHAAFHAHRLAIFARDYMGKGTDAATRRNLVQSIKTIDRAPFLNCLFGVIIGVHGKSPFLCQARDAANVAWHFALVLTGVIIAQISRNYTGALWVVVE